VEVRGPEVCGGVRLAGLSSEAAVGNQQRRDISGDLYKQRLV
jgi:hypothetical protein